MWSCSVLELQPSDEILQGLQERMLEIMDSTNGQDIANMLYAHASLGRSYIFLPFFLLHTYFFPFLVEKNSITCGKVYALLETKYAFLLDRYIFS